MDFWLILGFLIMVCLGFISWGHHIRRYERCVQRFYWPLRKYYPNGYVRQTKIVVFIRKRFKLDASGSIHWVISLQHYFQYVILLIPVLMLILMLFYPPLLAMSIAFTVWFGIELILVIIYDVFRLVQFHRCKKIKKIDPKYSKCDFY